MNKIRSFIEQNRRGITLGITIIVFVFIVIPGINQTVKNQEQKQIEKEKNATKLTEDEKNMPTESILYGEKSVPLSTTKQNVKIIEEFIEKCNNHDIEGAYNMLTDDCKETLFTSAEGFEQSYYKLIFSERRIGNMENYISRNNRTTYLVTFYEDVLSSGKTEDTHYYQDYITVDNNSESRQVKYK